MKEPVFIAEKRIGDFTVAVVADPGINGPYEVRVYGGLARDGRALACRLQNEEQARKYLAAVSSRTLMQERMF